MQYRRRRITKALIMPRVRTKTKELSGDESRSGAGDGPAPVLDVGVSVLCKFVMVRFYRGCRSSVDCDTRQ